MSTHTHSLLIALVVALAAGCGGNTAPTSGSTTGGSTGNPPGGIPFSDLHGALVVEQGTLGPVFAFLADGATTAWELGDASAVVAAGGHVDSTLTVSGEFYTPNAHNQTLLGESIVATTFALDDYAGTGRLWQVTNPPITVLRDNDGDDYELLGPLGATLKQQPFDRPLRVTGRIDPAHVSLNGTPGLIVTSFRETVEIGFATVGGMIGVNESFLVDDLPRTGAQRYDLNYFSNFMQPTKGRGRLGEADRVALEAAVAAANLRSQPKLFPQTYLVFDIPTQYIDFADKDGSLRITIQRPTVLPPEVEALVQLMNTLRQKVARGRVLETGTQSGVTTPGTQVIRDQAALDALWLQHSPGNAAPTVDFNENYVVALFMGQQSTGGYTLELDRLERFGDAIHMTTVSTSPTGPAPSVLTFPFEIVAVEHEGALGDVYVDGVKQ